MLTNHSMSQGTRSVKNYSSFEGNSAHAMLEVLCILSVLSQRDIFSLQNGSMDCGALFHIVSKPDPRSACERLAPRLFFILIVKLSIEHSCFKRNIMVVLIENVYYY